MSLMLLRNLMKASESWYLSTTDLSRSIRSILARRNSRSTFRIFREPPPLPSPSKAASSFHG